MDNGRVNALMELIYEKKQVKEYLESQIASAKTNMDKLDTEISSLSEELLAELKAGEVSEYINNGLFANVFAKENIGYTSDEAVLKYLKENNYSEYVKTKVTESLDKRPLNKALKTDKKLAAALEAMTVKTTTEYVVVTNEENHQKMLEHIEEGKTK